MDHQAGLVESALIEAERAADGALLDEADVEMIVGADPSDDGDATHRAQRWTLLGGLLEPHSELKSPLAACPAATLRWRSVPVQASAIVDSNVDRAGLTRLV